MTKTLRGSCERWLARLSWTLQSEGNPLRRPVDRKGRLIAGLLVIFLIAGPLVAVLGTQLSYAASLKDMHAQRSWREVTATLVENATDSYATPAAPGHPSPRPGGPPRMGMRGTAFSRSTAQPGPGSTHDLGGWRRAAGGEPAAQDRRCTERGDDWAGHARFPGAPADPGRLDRAAHPEPPPPGGLGDRVEHGGAALAEPAVTRPSAAACDRPRTKGPGWSWPWPLPQATPAAA